jgi:hypothetical protein
VKFVTARLPLAGHVSLAKNTHLPCLAVAQTLMVFREVDRYRRAGLFTGAQSEKDEDPETETRGRVDRARLFLAREGGRRERLGVGRNPSAVSRVPVRAFAQVRAMGAAVRGPEREGGRSETVAGHRRSRAFLMTISATF